MDSQRNPLGAVARWGHSVMRQPLLVAALILVAQAGHAAQAGAKVCPPNCVVVDSVVNAAGVDPDMFTAIAFRKGSVTPTVSASTLKAIVSAYKAKGEGKLMQLTVAADANLKGDAATRQAVARATALQRQLTGAGIPAAKVSVTGR